MFKQVAAYLRVRPLSYPVPSVVVHLPLAGWTLGVLFDLVAVFARDPQIREDAAYVSLWSIAIASVFAVPTVLTGLAEFMDMPKRAPARTLAGWHVTLNVALLAGYLGQAVIRPEGFVPARLAIVNALQFALLLLNLYIGGRLVSEYHMDFRGFERRPA